MTGLRATPTRVFMLADLHNFYGKLSALPDAIKEAHEFKYAFPELEGQAFCHYMAERVAEAFAERVADDWDYPTEYDLVVWEVTGRDDDEPTAPMIRVKITPRSVLMYFADDVEEVHVAQVPL